MFSKYNFTLHSQISYIFGPWQKKYFTSLSKYGTIIEKTTNKRTTVFVSKSQNFTTNSALFYGEGSQRKEINFQSIDELQHQKNNLHRDESMLQNFIRTNRLLKTTGLIGSLKHMGNAVTHGIPSLYPIREKQTSCGKSIKDGCLEKLFLQLSEPVINSRNKITVVGSGNVGMACVFSLLTENVTNDIVLINKGKDDLLEGEKLDTQHGALFLKNYNIQTCAGDDYSLSKNSRICIITAGERQQEGESRLNLLQRNVEHYKSIIPELVKHSPDTILLIVTNPVDPLTFVAWKLSGLPVHRVIGSGTHLDTARFRLLLAEKLKIAPIDCQGWIIGEHGDSSVPVWSSVNVAGTKLIEINPKIGTCDDIGNWGEIHKNVVESAGAVIKLKGYTNWAVGLAVTDICIGILKNLKSLYAVSTLVKGFHGVEDEVFLSLPVSLGENGISQVVKQKLDDNELCNFRNSVKTIAEVNRSIKF